MPNQKKFLDSTGLIYFAGKLNDYPTNEILGAVINAIDGEIEDLKEFHLTRETITDIVTDLYPESSSSEIEDIVDDIINILSEAGEDMIEEILSDNNYENDYSSGGGSGSGGSIDLSSYAPLASPALTGVPTAPTAARGTNTTQLATTAFVQSAIKPTLLINAIDFPSNLSATITLTLTNTSVLYTLTETLNPTGITVLNPEYTGIYNITLSDEHLKSPLKSINMSSPNSYNLNVSWSTDVTYTLIIDKTNTNTNTACTYDDDAIGKIKGSSNWDSEPIFKDIRPCVFQNGVVNYYLNPNDWTKKYGTNEAADLSGADGDVMIEFPKFAYKIKTNDNTITVSISNNETIIENDSDYTYDAFSRLEEGDLNFFYKGAFKGHIDGNGKLRSLPGVLPSGTVNILNYRTAAQLNGPHYQQSTFAQLKAIQCLYLIKYGDRDGQTALGPGNTGTGGALLVNGYNTSDVNSISSANSTLSSGMNFGGASNGLQHMRLFGIEDFWGNIWEWVDGASVDASGNGIISWNSFSNEGITPTSETIVLNLFSVGYIKDVVGSSVGGFIPTSTTGGTSSTDWADQGRVAAEKILNVGGRWATGAISGPFQSNFDNGADKIDAKTTARLSYV